MELMQLVEMSAEIHRNTGRSGNLWCEHCQRSNHNHENCWKLYGKPQNWKDNKGNRSTSQNPRGFQIASEPGNKTGENLLNVSLNKDKLEQLYKLLTPSAATVSSPLGLNTSFLAQKGTFRTALSNTTEKLDPWIIDSGAQMVPLQQLQGLVQWF